MLSCRMAPAAARIGDITPLSTRKGNRGAYIFTFAYLFAGFCFIFLRQALLSVWPESYYVDQSDLELKNRPPTFLLKTMITGSLTIPALRHFISTFVLIFVYMKNIS